MLRVVGRRADGYHLLQTVFQFIDLADRITFSWLDDGRVELAHPLPGVPPESDLTVRAVRLLQQVSGVNRGVRMTLDKRLPMGGGLGGGSSDAATVLVALNELWHLGLSVQSLIELGLQLGADVPVFVKGVAAWAEGVGEYLTPLEPEESWYVVVVPACHVSTAEVFQSADLTRNNPPAKIADFLGGLYVNDCQSVVSRLYPPVKKALDALGRYGEARLTGTGGCVFAGFGREDEARTVAGTLEGQWRVHVAKGLNRSPLQDKLTRID